MTRYIVAGWLLIGYQAGTIAWYENKADCEAVRDYIDYWYQCVPDRFSVDEVRPK